MLVLTRKLGESITIDDNIKIRIEKIRGKQVRLGIDAPKETRIYREEVYAAIKQQNEDASQAKTDSTRAVANLLKPKL
jgi:carbon storage regulator